MDITQQIRDERLRQIDVEGYDAQHDAQHVCGEIIQAALCYEASGLGKPDLGPDGVPKTWPWEGASWNPKGGVADLVRAGALATAEQDRRRLAGLPPDPVAERIISDTKTGRAAPSLR